MVLLSSPWGKNLPMKIVAAPQTTPILLLVHTCGHMSTILDIAYLRRLDYLIASNKASPFI